MKISEIYEKYLIINLPDGSTVKPRPLTDIERKVLDLAEELNISPYIKTGGRRKGFKYIIHPLIAKKLKLK